VDDVKALLGPEGFSNAPLFDVAYYKDANFTELAKKSVTPFVDFDLGTEPGTGSPDASASVPSEKFSIRWTGTILPLTNGTYTFYADCENQVRMFVDGKLLLYKTSAPRREIAKQIKLAGDKPVQVKIEYVHATGDPSLHICWSGPYFDKRILTPVNGVHNF
jgi:hypothetical protein